MTSRQRHTCEQHATTVALVNDELEGAERRAAQRHLETCAECRTHFRRATASWLPRFRRYTIVERVGRGGFGEVYRAIHHDKQRSEALKVLSQATEVREEYFENEVHLIAQLRHPHIATLYEAHLRTSPAYYAMELVDGPQLNRWLADNDVSIEQRLEIFRTIVDALDYAHQAGVVHRDIKPQNVLINSVGRPHVVDFGIARWLAPQNEARRERGVGTPGYMAPEQLLGGSVDARADIYSLGVLLLWLLSGVGPEYVKRGGRLPGTLRRRGLNRPDDLAAIIRRATAELPEQRYQSCGELLADLQRYQAGQAVAARPEPPLRRVRRVAALVLRNAPVSVATLALTMLAGLLALTLYNLGGRWYVAGDAGGRTAIIAITPGTLVAMQRGEIGGEVPGFDPNNRKSWRALFGRVLERLRAAEPSVVAWDFYFPDAQPAFDPHFAAGARDFPAPIIVGSHTLDLNGEPVISPAIAEAADAIGLLVYPQRPTPGATLDMTVAMRRGFNAWQPSLAIAALGAVRFPDATVRPAPIGDAVELRYQRRQAGPGIARWREETHVLPLQLADAIAARDATINGLESVQAGDQFLLSRFNATRHAAPPERIHALEDVLHASDATLREWFAGRPIVVGQMVPLLDQVQLGDGTWLHGCEAHAMALDGLLAGSMYVRFDRTLLTLRVVLWCGLGALLVAQRRLPLRWSVGALVGVGSAGVVAAVALAGWTAWFVAAPLWVESGVALACLLGSGSGVLALLTLRERHMRLQTVRVTAGEQTSTLAETLALSEAALVTSRSGSGSTTRS